MEPKGPTDIDGDGIGDICDYVDNDCDGTVDEETFTGGQVGASCNERGICGTIIEGIRECGTDVAMCLEGRPIDIDRDGIGNTCDNCDFLDTDETPPVDKTRS